MTTIRAEVCVVGGGPAGASVALRLAALGHEVCLVEREAFPRRHVGESLTPGIWPLLERLGVVAEIERTGFLPARDAVVRWEQDEAERVDARERGPGVLVDRGRFDAALLAAAAARGVRVLAPARARRVERRDGGWRVAVSAAGGPVEIAASIIADASGRAGFLPGERRPTSARTLALFGYWAGEAMPATTQVEAGADAWYWGAPLPDGTFNAMVFLDPGDPRIQRRGLLDAAYRALLEQSTQLAACARGRLVHGALARDATAYAAAEVVGEGWIKLGEAGFAIDPLSSTGVEKAIQTGLVGSSVLHTTLTRPAGAGLAAQLYRDRATESSTQHARWAAGHYAEVRRHADRPFWQRRAPVEAISPRPAPPTRAQAPDLLRHPGARVVLSPRASLLAVPCLQGDLVEAKLALHHPDLDRPVAYLGEIELGPLLDHLHQGTTLRALIQAWSERVTLDRALRIAGWLGDRGLLVVEP
jgi:flavin-dependent dehydrogenase